MIVVLGRSECGFVKGAMDDARLGSLTGVLQQIRPSLAKLDCKGMPSSKDKASVQRVAEQNAKDAAAQLGSRSETIANRVREGQLKIVHAMHDGATGKVAWFGRRGQGLSRYRFSRLLAGAPLNFTTRRGARIVRPLCRARVWCGCSSLTGACS